MYVILGLESSLKIEHLSDEIFQEFLFVIIIMEQVLFEVFQIQRIFVYYLTQLWPGQSCHGVIISGDNCRGPPAFVYEGYFAKMVPSHQ